MLHPDFGFLHPPSKPELWNIPWMVRAVCAALASGDLKRAADLPFYALPTEGPAALDLTTLPVIDAPQALGDVWLGSRVFTSASYLIRVW